MSVLLFTVAILFTPIQNYSIDFICIVPKKVEVVKKVKKYEGM